MKKYSIVFLTLAIVITPGLFSQSCNCWLPLDTAYKIVPFTQGAASKDRGVAPEYRNDDGSTMPVKLPFNFCFYGQNFDTLFINNNGVISFKKPIYNFKNTGAPYGTDTLLVAPFYSDVNTLDPFASGLVYYKMTATSLIIKWNAVGYQGVDDDFFNTYQLIITDGADPILPKGTNVSFCYYNMGWATSDVWGGFGGYGGINSIVGLSKGNGINFALLGTFGNPGGTFSGPSDLYNGLQWLNQKAFLFNTCLSTNRIPSVMIKDSYVCDTINLCAGNQATFTASFLYAEQGQNSILSATSPDFTGFSVVDTNTGTNSIATIKVKVAPTVIDIGAHTLSIKSTDKNFPLLSTTRSFVVIVDVCTGLSQINRGNNFSVYPEPNNGYFNIRLDDKNFATDYDAKIFDMLGNEIYSVKLSVDQTEVNISDHSKGVYFLKLYQYNSIIGVRKIILQ